MNITFLGTGCSAPTIERGLNAVALEFEGFRALFDCGEGTQRQLIKAGFKMMQLDAVFISHFHSDHFLGLPGLLATMSLYEREAPLTVFGPKGIKQRIEKALELALAKCPFEVKAKELRQGKVLEEKNFYIEAFPLEHSTACFGFCFREKDKVGRFLRKKAEKLGIPVGPLYAELQQGKSVTFGKKTFKPEQVMDYSKGRKGRKVCIVIDTMAGEKYIPKIKNADVLVHEAVFLEDLRERALETKHSTARDAGKTAKKANVKKLFLTHISPRYLDEMEIKKEALREFKNVVVAKDLLKVCVPKNPEGELK